MSDSPSIVSSIYRSGKLYDLLFPLDANRVHFWSTLAQAYGDPILEMMAGTGLISIPLAQQGYQVTGLEMAETMVAEAKHKAGVEAKWVVGDARNFELGELYKLIYLPSNSICHLLTREDLEACLASVTRHLHPEGRFVVEVFVPNLSFLLRTPTEEQKFSEYIDPNSGEPVVITQRSWYDAATQIGHNALYKRVGDGPVQADGELTMRMYFPQELDALFWYNGFAIEHKYGDRDRRPFDAQSSMQYYILKRR